MLSKLFGIGRAYKKLPPHNNFKELADNMEAFGDYLIDRSLGSFASQGYLKAPGRIENKLGHDLKMLVEYARAHVPSDTDGLHFYSRPKMKETAGT